MSAGLRRALRDKRGMTLAELLIAMSIALVLIGVVAAILLSTMNQGGRAAAIQEDDLFGDAVFELVRSLLIDATAIGGGDETLEVDGNGALLYNGESLYESIRDGMYGERRSVAITITARGDSYVDLAVQVTDSADANRLVYSRSSGFHLLNTTMDASVTLPGASLRFSHAADGAPPETP